MTPQDAKFTNKELSEFGALADCSPVVDGKQLPGRITGEFSKLEQKLRERNLSTLHGFAALSTAQKKNKRVHFQFYARPFEILGSSEVEGIRLERTENCDNGIKGSGEMFDLPCGAVISAIGYQASAPLGVPMDSKRGTVRNDEGEVEPGLFVVGWAKRGPSGVIGTNRADGETVAERVMCNLQPSGKLGGAALETHLRQKAVRWVSFEDWLRIDAAETAAAAPGAPRNKFTSFEDLFQAID